MAILTNMCMIQDVLTGKVLVQKRQKNWKGYAFPGGDYVIIMTGA